MPISRILKIRASMTVEAAVVLPVFLFFFLQLGSAIEMIRLHGNLQLALWEVGNQMSVYGHVLGGDSHAGDSGTREQGIRTSSIEYRSTRGAGLQSSKEEAPGEASHSFLTELAGLAWSYTYVKGRLIDYLGEDYLESSPLSRGSSSLQFMESDIWESEDTFELTVTYQVAPLAGLAAFSPFRMANKYYGHLWTGYRIPDAETTQQRYVYVTQSGEVYHTDPGCTHLKLSVRQVGLAEALGSRNEQGERYGACELCWEGMPAGKVYITSQGDCYHAWRECSGLKRTVYRIPIGEAENYRPCSRCAGAG